MYKCRLIGCSLFLFVLAFLLGSCTQAPPESVEVTRIVEITREIEMPVTRIVEIENTIEVEVTRIVEAEVTKIVVATQTPSPTPKSLTEVDPSIAFAVNNLGELEQDGIKVELARIIVMHRDAFKPDLNFDDASDFDGHEYVAEIIWRITNNTEKSVEWQYDDINARINGKQITLYDWLFNSFGESPTDEIFSGSTITGGVWFGVGNTKPDDVVSFDLLLGSPLESEAFARVSSNFIITSDLSGEHTWVPIPDDLKTQ